MAQATRNIEIHEASFHYLGGSIAFRVCPSNARYRLQFGNGLRIASCDKKFRPISWECTSEDAVVEILGSRHWSWTDFIAVWQGWASGYEAGRNSASIPREVKEEMP